LHERSRMIVMTKWKEESGRLQKCWSHLDSVLDMHDYRAGGVLEAQQIARRILCQTIIP